MKKALLILSAVLLLAVVGTLALRAKPEALPSAPVDVANESKAGLRPVATDSPQVNPAANEQERLQKLYGEESWRVSSRTAEDVIACVQAIRQTVESHMAELTPEASLGSLALTQLTGPDVLDPGKEAAVQQLGHDFVLRKWKETRQSLERLDCSPAPLLELLLASDACASGKMSLKDYETLREGNPDFEAVAIPVDPTTRSVNFGFGSPLKDPEFVAALGAYLNDEGRARLDEAVRKETPAHATSSFDLLPPTRLESLTAQAKGARQIMEALMETSKMK
jgi:hypothetical protein